MGEQDARYIPSREEPVYRPPADTEKLGVRKGGWKKARSVKVGVSLGGIVAGGDAVEASTKRYDAQMEALVEMLGSTVGGKLSSLSYMIKSLQHGDAYAFSQMMEKLMNIAHAQDKRADDEMDSDVSISAAVEWTKVMKWAQHKVLESKAEIASPHLYFDNIPESVSVSRVQSLLQHTCAST